MFSASTAAWLSRPALPSAVTMRAPCAHKIGRKPVTMGLAFLPRNTAPATPSSASEMILAAASTSVQLSGLARSCLSNMALL